MCVGWLCADDYYFPHTFAEVSKVFAARPDIDVVYGDTVFADRAGRFLGYFPGLVKTFPHYQKLLHFTAVVFRAANCH